MPESLDTLRIDSAEVEPLSALKLNVPQWYAQKDFLAWLNEYADPKPGQPRHATWHLKGAPNEYSDVFVIYDNGEGSDFEFMPAWAWDEIDRVCRQMGVRHGVVWLTNLDT